MKMFKNLTSLSSLVPGGNGRGKTARTIVLASVAVAGLVTAVVRTAVATPPSNIVSGTVLARASFLVPTDIKIKVDDGSEEVIHAPELQETVIQQIIIGPGGSTGWHSHPGPAVAMIKAGALALYSSEDPTCTPRIYLPGQAFVDHGQGHVHMARNLSPTDNLEVWVTYFDVPPGAPVRLDAANPGNCGF
jgi:quercetin dioxygenase-like cupin family protein